MRGARDQVKRGAATGVRLKVASSCGDVAAAGAAAALYSHI